MAAGASDILVRAAELEFGFVVIEAGRTPQACIVARGAILGFTRQRAELADVDVFVAFRALLENGIAIDDAFEPHRRGRRAVALIAWYALVGAGQREAGRGVVERRKFMPRTHDVADFAAHFEPASFRMHPLGKLSLMRIKMARLATEVGEMVCRHVFPIGQDLVALATTDRYVPALKRKLGLAMARQGEIGRRPTLHGMAVFATVLMGQDGELGLMSIHVAIQTDLELHAVLRRLAGGTVALVAGHGRMFPQQGIRALGV